jgi:glycyl-tRNA synthetase beta subunit
LEILKDIILSSKILNELKSEVLYFISKDQFNGKNKEELKKKYLNYINDINQNSVVKNIFQKKDQNQQVELLNEILKELNEIKFSKKIDKLENRLMKEFDEKSYSDLMQLKSQINKE